jgi:hypothetical protein
MIQTILSDNNCMMLMIIVECKLME